MTKVLILNHRGSSLASLVELVKSAGGSVDLIEPETIGGPIPVRGYGGVVASGGYLKSTTHRDVLQKYSRFFEQYEGPFLGVCLGLRILGYCYGARIRKTAHVVGEYRVALRDFPLCPELSEFSVFQNHTYEVLSPLPSELEDFTAAGESVQAAKVVGKNHFAVQFHPEVGESPARAVVKNFVSLCSGKR